MKLAFTKMQGAGNDFVVLDGVSQRLALTPAQMRQLADRHFGVGCDQILLVEPPRAAGIRRGLLDADARVRVSTRGGDLTIRWEGGDNPVWMTGPAVAVFEGEIEIDEC